MIGGNGFGRGAAMAALLMTTGLGGIAMTGAAQAQSAAGTQKNFDIAAQPLPEALVLFGRQSGLQITAAAEMVGGRQGSAVSGNLAPGAALSRLLAGTGLTFRFTKPNTVVLELAPQASNGAIQLGAVRVQGEADIAAMTVKSDLNVSEKSGEYTVAAMDTATGLRLSARETPQSVSVVTRQQLDNEAALTIKDALKYAAGINVYDSEFFGQTFTLRGFNLNSIQINGAPVSFGATGQAQQDMAIYDRVEILRGTAGLTQGAGKAGGLINLVRKMPTEEFQAYALARAGSWNNYRAEADMSGALSGDGNLRVRVVGAVQDRDSFTDYVDMRKYIGYGVVQAEFSPTTLLNVGVDWVKESGTPNATGIGFYSDGGDIDYPRSIYLGAPWNQRQSEATTAFAELTQELGSEWRAKANLTKSWGKIYSRYLAASGGLGVDRASGLGPFMGVAFQLWNDNSQTAADFTVDGPFSLFGRTHELVIGGTYQTSYGDTYRENFADYHNEAINVFNFDPEAYALPTEISPALTTRTKTTQGGAYGLLRFSLLDDVKLFGGTRINWWKTDILSNSFGPPATSSSTRYASNARLVPYGGITWDARPGTTLYASYTDVFEPQYTFDRNSQLLDPLVGSNYEIGIKQGLAGDRLLATLAAYRLEQTNRPLTDETGPTPCPIGGSIYCSIAGGKVRVQGVEAELSGQFSRGWQGVMSYTLSNTKYLTGPSIGKAFNTQQPKHMVKMSSSYNLADKMDWLTIGASVYYQSETRAAVGLVTEVAQKGYILLDAMLSAKLPERISLSLNMNNIFDKRYYKFINGKNVYNYYGDPRNFMVTARKDF